MAEIAIWESFSGSLMKRSGNILQPRSFPTEDQLRRSFVIRDPRGPAAAAATRSSADLASTNSFRAARQSLQLVLSRLRISTLQIGQARAG